MNDRATTAAYTELAKRLSLSRHSAANVVMTTCTAAPAHLVFTGLLRPDGAGPPSYPTTWSVRQDSGCRTWSLRTPDGYPKGRWSAQLRLSTGGMTYRTPSRPLLIR